MMLIKLTPAVTHSLPQDMSLPLERERNAELEVTAEAVMESERCFIILRLNVESS